MDGYKSGKPDVPYWLEQVRLGLHYRRKVAYEEKWNTWREFYRGEWAGDILPNNLFFKMIRTIVPRIYFRNPSISIIATKPGFENAILAKILERTDNKLIRRMKLKKHMKRIVQSGWMFGTGIGKIGFGSQFQSTPETIGETVAPAVGRMREEIEYNQDVLQNMPWFHMAPTSSYVVPALTQFGEDKRWDCFIFNRPVSDVKIDPRLENNTLLAGSIRSFQIGAQNLAISTPVEMLELYEIRDKKTGKVFIISPGQLNEPLLFEDDEFLSLGIEVGKSLVFNEDDERFWGIPSAQILEPLQLEANEIKTLKMKHRRLSLIKILYKSGTITDEEFEKLVGPAVAAGIRVTGRLEDIKFVQVTDIPAGLNQADAYLSQEVKETMGFSRNEFGEFKPGSKSPTAFETGVVKQAGDIRIDEFRDMTADMIVEVMIDIHPIIFKHWTGDQVEEVIGPAGIPFWIKFRPAMLKRTTYEVKVDPDSSVPETKDVREQKAVQTYEILKQNPLIDPFKLTSHLLRELHGIAFDDMLVGLPPGQGLTQDKPIEVGQFAQVLQNFSQKAPQLTGPAKK